MSEIKRKGTRSPRSFQFRLLALVLGINLAGGVLLFLYFSVINSPPLSQAQELRNWPDLILLAFPAFLAAGFSWYYSRPVFRHLSSCGAEEQGRGNPTPAPADATAEAAPAETAELFLLRRRALRFPLVGALAGIVGWMTMGLLIALRFWIAGRSFGFVETTAAHFPGAASDVLSEGFYRGGSFLRMHWLFLVQSVKLVGLSAVVGGMLSASLFFMLEWSWQKELPRFFPGGRLSAVSDRFFIPVRYRLIVIFVLVGTVPLVLMGVLSYQRAAAMLYLRPEEVLRGLLLFNMFMVLVGVGLAVVLAVFVARSVSDPLSRLEEAILRVKAGYLWLQLPVRANDELGRLTEGFNDMVRALGEKEAAIEELTRELEKKVEERTRELSQTLLEKEQTQMQLVQSEKMASLGQLVAGIAHEINNPIGYIYANTDHLARLAEKMNDAFAAGDPLTFAAARDRLLRLIQSTREGALRTKEIVQGLRTFSRRDPSQRKPIDLHETLETALMLLGHELKRGITVLRDYAPLPPVVANPGELTQVFINIMVNSLQAIGETGELHISSRRQGSMVSVKIRDTGEGISPEALPHIFEPFFTTKEVGKGTGLGLSIAYGIVEAHGGELRATSEPGRGTEMEVRLPIPAAEK